MPTEEEETRESKEAKSNRIKLDFTNQHVIRACDGIVLINRKFTLNKQNVVIMFKQAQNGRLGLCAVTEEEIEKTIKTYEHKVTKDKKGLYLQSPYHVKNVYMHMTIWSVPIKLLSQNRFVIKDYSENQGLLETLLNEKLVEEIKMITHGQILCRFTDEVMTEIEDIYNEIIN
jgi:hypothetical protein